MAQLNQQGEDEQPQLSYIITDHAGTVSELCDESGTILWHGHQALWGKFSETTTNKDNIITCDLRYQGQIHDRETGLYYNRHRYYDSDSCQYLSSDPIGLAGGIRPQSYVADPVNWIDPLGLAKEGCPKGNKKTNSVSYGKNWDEKRKKHFQQMRQEAKNHGVDMPKKFKDPNTENAQKELISKIVSTGEQKSQKYMTIENAIWTKSHDSIVIQKPNGEFLTYLRYSQGKAASFWNGGHK
ncbi:MAG: RHS domain-containing protein [Gammaproteobacteria bacterium]|nr:RHS domain-containing protein [Gammaproteobacteria bacterium]